MKIFQSKFSNTHGWETLRDDKTSAEEVNLVIVFGSTALMSNVDVYNHIEVQYPKAKILLNTTSGEIIGTQVNNETISLTAIQFEKTTIKTAITQIDAVKNSFDAGYYLARALDPVNLKNVLVISDGSKVNGSDLVMSLQQSLPKGTMITGGLAGNESPSAKTLVGLNEPPTEGRIVAIGFYGSALTVSCAGTAGWDPFGPERMITKSKDNTLFELDNEPALDIYKLYLGELTAQLPKSSLLFPLSMRMPDSEQVLIRTIHTINESNRSITFAGNMPYGAFARMMKSDTDHLIQSVSAAAEATVKNILSKPDLAILISGAGRKTVLDTRIEEEVNTISRIYGKKTAITGFYSTAEISTATAGSKCELHNQTMTITTFSEQ